MAVRTHAILCWCSKVELVRDTRHYKGPLLKPILQSSTPETPNLEAQNRAFPLPEMPRPHSAPNTTPESSTPLSNNHGLGPELEFLEPFTLFFTATLRERYLWLYPKVYSFWSARLPHPPHIHLLSYRNRSLKKATLSFEGPNTFRVYGLGFTITLMMMMIASITIVLACCERWLC